MKSFRLLIPAAIGIAFAVGACGSASQPTWTFAPAPAAQGVHGATSAAKGTVTAAADGNASAAGNGSAANGGSANGGAVQAAIPVRGGSSAAAASSIVHEDITIVTGDMIDKTEYPAYVPSAITLPAHSFVLITITNFDDATPLPKGSENYANASGILGDISVQPIDTKDPNGSAGKASTMTSMKPDDVSHTFTVPALGVNVPIPAHARISFMIQTGNAGTYQFRCFDPCGAGSSGWGTAMATKDYMEGTITVV